MSSLGPLGLGLSVVFGTFIVVLLVELYYILFCRKRRHADTSRERGLCQEEDEEDLQSHTTEMMYYNLLCCKKKPNDPRLVNRLVGEDGHCSPAAENAMLASLGEMQTSPLQSELVAKLIPLRGAGGGDHRQMLQQLHGLLESPRLLFTIEEETKDDLDSEDARSRGRRSRRTSRASSEFFPQIDSASVASSCQTPLGTPPSSPPFATSIRSPPIIKHLIHLFKEEEFSSSSSESITPPVPSSPPPARRHLGALMEETSSSSSTSSSCPTPFASSPPRHSHIPVCFGNPLGLLFDSPSPPSGLVLAPIVNEGASCTNLLWRKATTRELTTGIPILGVSPSTSTPLKKNDPHFMLPCHRTVGIFSDEFSPSASPSNPISSCSATPSPSWSLSSYTPTLCSALSSPLCSLPAMHQLDVTSSFVELQRFGKFQRHDDGGL